MRPLPTAFGRCWVLASRAAWVAIAWAAATALPAVAGEAGENLGAGIDRAYMDPAVRPQDDLFRAANGRWLKDVRIPPDKPDWGGTREVFDRTDGQVRKIVEGLAAADHPAGSDEQKIADFYRSYLDEAAIEAAGLAPLEPWLAQVEALKTPRDLAVLLGRLQGVASVPLVVSVDADPREPGINLAYTWQGGLGLPDRDYYLQANARYTPARKAYREYVTTLLRLAGDAQAAAHAAQVEAFERRLAGGQWSNVANRDALERYNPMDVTRLARRAPGLDWPAFFAAAALPGLTRLSVSQPSYARVVAAMVRQVPIATWKLYLRVRLLDDGAEVLPRAFRDAAFAMHGKAIRGQPEAKPRWQQATAALDLALGEAVGRFYVAEYFPAPYKARMQELVRNLFAAYEQSIDGLSWMSPPTRERAREKLHKYQVKIGYPDTWRDYGRLEVRAGDAYGNVVRAGRFEYERQAAHVGQPVDRSEWGMTPQTVNAYYNASFNEIVFPAAILQPPYFDMSADDAYNYGATGTTIGHEISHGFDDEGSRYNGDGKLEEWWTPADRRAFDALGAKLAAQFSAYRPLPGLAINGKLTLGENIADLSGLQIAFKAWKLSLGDRPAPVLDGFSGAQRFFFAYAQGWRETQRDAELQQLITSDPHSPPEYRVNGVVINSDGFHETFATQPGDRLWKAPAARIRIW